MDEAGRTRRRPGPPRWVFMPCPPPDPAFGVHGDALPTPPYPPCKGGKGLLAIVGCAIERGEILYFPSRRSTIFDSRLASRSSAGLRS